MEPDSNENRDLCISIVVVTTETDGVFDNAIGRSGVTLVFHATDWMLGQDVASMLCDTMLTHRRNERS